MRISSASVSHSLVVSVFMFAVISQYEALEAPNEQVGYRACVHLMLRLVDSLKDACDLYLNGTKEVDKSTIADMIEPIGESVPMGGALASELGVQIVETTTPPLQLFESGLGGALGSFLPSGLSWFGNNPQPPKNLDGIENLQNSISETLEDHKVIIEDLMTSTQPVSIEVPAQVTEEGRITEPPAIQEQNFGIQIEEDCWPKALDWLRTRLVSLEDRLVDSNKQPNSLSFSLDEFKHLHGYLSDVCPPLKKTDENIVLNYLTEAIEVLAELDNELDKRVSSLKDSTLISAVNPFEIGNENEKRDKQAAELIKQQYSYLTQIVTTYNLLFNAKDADLLGHRKPSSEGPLMLVAFPRPFSMDAKQ